MMPRAARFLQLPLHYAGVLLALAAAGWFMQPLRSQLQQQEQAAGLQLPPPDYTRTDALSL